MQIQPKRDCDVYVPLRFFIPPNNEIRQSEPGFRESLLGRLTNLNSLGRTQDIFVVPAQTGTQTFHRETLDSTFAGMTAEGVKDSPSRAKTLSFECGVLVVDSLVWVLAGRNIERNGNMLVNRLPFIVRLWMAEPNRSSDGLR
jgi:hypothetical protein